MPALDDTLAQKISVLESKQQRRVLQQTEMVEGVYVLRGGKKLISFSSNDYLGLSGHQDVVAAAHAALEKYSAGAGASRLVSGNHPLYAQLESTLAGYKKTDAACIFGSGYLANLGAITALVGKGDLILADKYAHACMLDAARLSGATLMRFAHNNMAHLRMLLEANRTEHHHCLLLTETVFSMDGDRAPLGEIALLAKEFDAWLMTDDAHGLGVLPHEQNPADIQMGTLSKAAGVYGGYVCGSQALIDYLQTSARSLIYSTALPPSVVASAAAAVNIIATQPEIVAKPLANARYFTELMALPEAQSAIVPVMLEKNDKALRAARLLEENGFLVVAIRPPTVPENTARLRFAFSALHTREHIEQVVPLLKGIL
ncbi:MAG: 8-amino-7-oxononanoate synthase [Alphaproteobacteria bacterium]|nr:8-amino-7-oxononanoate synthase [Alphaproteobacteria bacterium]